MNDLFNRAVRTGQSGSDVKLSFRQEERLMPGMFNGNATDHTQYIFKMEAYLSTLGSREGKRVKYSEPPQQKPRTRTTTRRRTSKQFWKASALNSTMASCSLTTTTGEVGTLVRRVLHAFLASEHGRS